MSILKSPTLAFFQDEPTPVDCLSFSFLKTLRYFNEKSVIWAMFLSNHHVFSGMGICKISHSRGIKSLVSRTYCGLNQAGGTITRLNGLGLR